MNCKNFNTIKSAVIIGSAIGDALGEPVEFCTREELMKEPVTDFRANPLLGLPEGSTWSDDTSMVLATLDALSSGMLNYDLVMLNFGKWSYRGDYTPKNFMFDIGSICSKAIDNYFAFHKPYTECGLTDEMSNGNGSLMRIHPFTLFLAEKEMTVGEKINIIHNASALTHAHERSKVGCGIFSFVLWELLKRQEKASVYRGLEKAKAFYNENDYKEINAYADLFLPDFADFPCEKIKSTGYVVDTLSSALWCLLTTESYEECVLKAVNLGDDTDTVGAVAGAFAGALYGYDAIPRKWRDRLLKREYMEKLCEKAYENKK